jgi:dTDP-4-amino-4,6-dideoxygalactose transaminase
LGCRSTFVYSRKQKAKKPRAVQPFRIANDQPMRPDPFPPLAVEGGPPSVPQGPPPWPLPLPAVREALLAAYADGSWGRYHGPYTERLREQLTALTGHSHAWLCASGTVAVELALRGLGIGPGDEVILGAYDFPGNFRSVEAVAAAVAPPTRAILVSHLHGHLADMPALRLLADKHQLALIEDACQVPGAMVAGRPAGSWGDCGVLSFGGSKLLTAGRGGAVVTSRPEVWQRIKVFAERGNDAYPLSELQAAVLLAQLPQLAALNAARARAVQYLKEKTEQSQKLLCLFAAPQGEWQPVYYKLPLRLDGQGEVQDEAQQEVMRRKFIAALQAEGVAADEGFRGFFRRSAQRCRHAGSLAEARRAATQTVLLHHPVLLEGEQTLAAVRHALDKVAWHLLRGENLSRGRH